MIIALFINLNLRVVEGGPRIVHPIEVARNWLLLFRYLFTCIIVDFWDAIAVVSVVADFRQIRMGTLATFNVGFDFVLAFQTRCLCYIMVARIIS